MVRLRCPQCRTVIEAPATGAPVCPNCGFSAPLAAPSPRASSPKATPAATVYPAQPYMAPPAPAPVAYAPPPAYSPEFQTLRPGEPAGKPRSFWMSLLLGIVTFGVYFFVWNYKAFRELDEEHGQNHAAAWYWTALAILLFGVMVFLVLVGVAVGTAPDPENPDVTGARLVYSAFALLWTAVFLSYAFREISKLERYRQGRGLPEGFQPVWFILLYILGALLIVPTIVAYFLLQKSMNEVWSNVYAQRQVAWPL